MVTTIRPSSFGTDKRSKYGKCAEEFNPKG